MISERLWEYITILAVVLGCPALEPRSEAWDTRVELAKSVIRWVRRDRKEQQVEWNARMAKYHADKATSWTDALLWLPRFKMIQAWITSPEILQHDETPIDCIIPKVWNGLKSPSSSLDENNLHHFLWLDADPHARELWLHFASVAGRRLLAPKLQNLGVLIVIGWSEMELIHSNLEH